MTYWILFGAMFSPGLFTHPQVEAIIPIAYKSELTCLKSKEYYMSTLQENSKQVYLHCSKLEIR